MKTIINNVQIKAVASYLPNAEISMSSLIDRFGKDQVSQIVNTTGINSIRVAAESMTSSDMCLSAAERLITAEGIDRRDIDGLVFVSQTPDYLLPSTSTCLQHKLGLTVDTVCQDIRYGCSGYIYGLFQAALWISSGACRNVLVLSGETNSRIVNENDKSLKMVMGDAGTATLVTSGHTSMGFHIQTDGKGFDKIIVPDGAFRNPVNNNSAILEWDSDGNGRTKMDMYMDGMAIFSFAITKVHKNINALLDHVGWDKDSVGLFALHQANRFMVDYIGRKLKVDSAKVPVNATKYGNTGPASIPLLLSDVCSRDKFELEKCVLCGFGVGLSWGSIVCDMSETNFYEPINS